jgi:hypothetical protein
MPRPSPKLEWCTVRLDDDFNWWVDQISDELHWDVDGLSILDPRQFNHILELCEPLREFGFDLDVLEEAFYPFAIEREEKGKKVRLRRVRETLLDSQEEFFALPDVMDDEKGPYADFLDEITRFRVKMLNDLIDFEQNLTVDEIEEDIRERNNADYFEGRPLHVFTEITNILEYVPDGFEIEEPGDEREESEDEDLEDIPDFEEDDENIEEDETMRWDEEDELLEEDEDDLDLEDDDDDFDIDEEEIEDLEELDDDEAGEDSSSGDGPGKS